MSSVINANGVLSPPPTEKANSVAASPPRYTLAGPTGRILCIADIRGDYHELNRLIREHDATAVIHTGDFGFMNSDSMERMADKILRHLVQYSPLIPPATRSQLLEIPAAAGRAALISQLNNSSIHFPLSQFPHLLTGAITFPVPVFTVWGLVEDVRVLEKFRTGEYEVHNLSIIDEATTRLIEVGGLKLRLFGLGGTVASHKLFDNGEGYATIAGGAGTMWSTALQMGELIDTAQRVYDPQETRLFISSASISRNGILPLIANALQADLTISGGLHFRYAVSFNEFSIHTDFDSYRQKLSASAQKSFVAVYEAVKDKVDSSLNEQQQALLKKILQVVQNVPSVEDGLWTNTWNWVLSDASCGHLLLSITDSRVSAETKTSGLNFAHRATNAKGPMPSATTAPLVPSSVPSAPPRQEPPQVARQAAPTRAPIGPGGAATTNKPAPTPASSTGPTTNLFKTPNNRALPAKGPAPVTASGATASAAPAAAASTSATPVANSVPAKPPAQPRHGRGQNSIAGQALTAAGAGKDKLADTKAAQVPTGPSKEREKPFNSSNAKSNGFVNGKISPANAKGPEKPAKEEQKKDAPASTKPDGDVSAPAAAVETKEGDKSSHSRETSSEIKPKRHSLYVKGIPVPTTEEELKAVFGDLASKIVTVNIIRDHVSKTQKDFAYVDFSTEEEMNEALKKPKESIRDTPINVSVSNPPVKRFTDTPYRGGGRGRGGSFRGGRGRGFGSISGNIRKESDGAAASGEKKD